MSDIYSFTACTKKLIKWLYLSSIGQHKSYVSLTQFTNLAWTWSIHSSKAGLNLKIEDKLVSLCVIQRLKTSMYKARINPGYTQKRRLLSRTDVMGLTVPRLSLAVSLLYSINVMMSLHRPNHFIGSGSHKRNPKHVVERGKERERETHGKPKYIQGCDKLTLD